MTTISETTSRKFAATPSCHACAGGAPARDGAPVIAVVGAPNSGKSTLFNGLTGAKAQMGNWPGTTVEVSRGAWRVGDEEYDVIDFPGAYSLDPMSPDEELTREMLIEKPQAERPDLVVVVVDAAALGRGLYMAAQLGEQPQRIVLAVTKLDVARAKGIDVDAQALQSAMGMPVVALDPRRKAGLNQLADAVGAALIGCSSMVGPVRKVDGLSQQSLEDARFAAIDAAVAAATGDVEDRRTLTDRIDNIVLHPLLGPVIFLAVMWGVFQVTTTVAAPLQDGLEMLITGNFADLVTRGLAAIRLDNPIVLGLLVDGIIGGVGMVLTFVPLMALMFLLLAVLEDCGYMARAAVVADRFMRAIGLPGKAFIPLIVGFGCNVPAISATRVLGNPRHRILTALLVPFTSCSARLTVYVMLGAVFFPEHAGTVVFAMYVISILLIILTGMLLRTTLWRTMPSEPLVIDLPTYQLPMARLALSVMWQRLRGFLKTASGIIVATVIVVWLLMSIPVVSGHTFGDEELAPQDTAYGAVSKTFAPVFEPAGFGTWSLTGPLVTGFVAKETVISTWAQTYAVDDVTDADADEQATSQLADSIRRDFAEASGGHTLAAVWAFMVFVLAYTPCVATLATQFREIGAKWTAFGLAAQLLVSWGLSVAVFQCLKLFL